MPSRVEGAEVFKKCALNCRPWLRSFNQTPDAVIHSPAEIIAACPTVVTRSRWPLAFTRSTQKPLSWLWKVTRSTRPARTSVALSVPDFMNTTPIPTDQATEGTAMIHHPTLDIPLLHAPKTMTSLSIYCIHILQP